MALCVVFGLGWLAVGGVWLAGSVLSTDGDVALIELVGA
jgi:hypothetical protein